MLKLNCLNIIFTVNSEIFARLYFRETSYMRSFVKIIPSRNGENSLPLLMWAKHAKTRFLNVANKSYNVIRENKMFAKISEFTVFKLKSTYR